MRWICPYAGSPNALMTDEGSLTARATTSRTAAKDWSCARAARQSATNCSTSNIVSSLRRDDFAAQSAGALPLQEVIAAVRRAEVHDRADRHDSRRIDVVVRDVIVPLDLIEIDRFGDAVDLIEIAQIAVEVRIVGDAAKIALEVTVVNGIEAHERHEESPVGFERLRLRRDSAGMRAVPPSHRSP